MNTSTSYTRGSQPNRRFAGFSLRGGLKNKFGHEPIVEAVSLSESTQSKIIPSVSMPVIEPKPIEHFVPPSQQENRQMSPPKSAPPLRPMKILHPSLPKSNINQPSVVKNTLNPPMVKRKPCLERCPSSILSRPSSSEIWPMLDIPEGYEEQHPVRAKLISNAHIKFHPPDNVEEFYSETPFTPFNTEPSYETGLSEEVGDMGSGDAKFEAAELIEYNDRSWCIAMPIAAERTPDKMHVMQVVYSYQRGVDRFTMSIDSVADLRSSLLVKYRRKRNHDDVEVIPIYSALPSTGLMSLKYRHNKGIELRVYGLVSFVDFVKDHTNMSHQIMVWTDALGPVYLSAAERSNLRRRVMNDEEKMFAPLRMVNMTVKGDFNISVPLGTTPKWKVVSIQPLIEESGKDPNIGRGLWPARVIRFDDLIMQKAPATSKECWFISRSNPDQVLVFACPALFGIIHSGGTEYAKNGVMCGFVVPVFNRNQFAYYEALIIGPLRVVMVITEGRGFNYYPKTLAPSVEAKRQLYREHCEQQRNRWEESQMAEKKRSVEFDFDFKIT